MSSLFPTAYLPPISYISKLLRIGPVSIEAHEHFMKKSIRNRCGILGANGPILLSVPVDHDNRWRKPIGSIRISSEDEWRRSHWKSIESAYAHAPYFEYYEHDLKKVLFGGHETLFDLNSSLLRMTFRWLKQEKDFDVTSEFRPYGEPENDFRMYWEKEIVGHDTSPYNQVFSGKSGFKKDLSIIDLVFNTGPDAIGYL